MIDYTKGSRPILFQEADIYSKIESKLLDLFRLWGYSRILTSAITSHEMFRERVDRDFKRTIHLANKISAGKVLSLRSDITVEVAETVAWNLRNRKVPIRIAYSEPIYRSVVYGAGEMMESRQVGIELVGSKECEADAEIITIATEALEMLDFDKIIISIGHAGYLKSVLSSLDLDNGKREELIDRLRKKDLSYIYNYLQSQNMADSKAGKILLKISSISDQFENGLDDIPSLDKKTDKYLQDIKTIHKIVTERGMKDKLILNLSELKEASYYTGVTLEGFVEGVSSPVLLGGRYDDLNLSLSDANTKVLAGVGFAVDLDKVAQSLISPVDNSDFTSADILIVSSLPVKKRMQIATQLRKKNIRVTLYYNPASDRSDIISYAIDSRISYILFLKEKMEIINTKDGNSKLIDESELGDYILNNIIKKRKLCR